MLPIVRLGIILPRDDGPNDRAAANRIAGKRSGRLVAWDRPQRGPQKLRPRRPHPLAAGRAAAARRLVVEARARGTTSKLASWRNWLTASAPSTFRLTATRCCSAWAAPRADAAGAAARPRGAGGGGSRPPRRGERAVKEPSS